MESRAEDLATLVRRTLIADHVQAIHSIAEGCAVPEGTVFLRTAVCELHGRPDRYSGADLCFRGEVQAMTFGTRFAIPHRVTGSTGPGRTGALRWTKGPGCRPGRWWCQRGRHLHVLVRGDSLAASVSAYPVDRLLKKGRVAVDANGFVRSGADAGEAPAARRRSATSCPGNHAVGDVRGPVKRVASGAGEGSVVISEVWKHLNP